MSTLFQDDFKGTDRFQIQRCLGEGGFGVVYQVYDRDRKAVVALKKLRKDNVDGLYRFKQEFRALTDIHHQNLVALYELLTESNEWFFTMELVQGVELLDYINEANQHHDRLREAFRQLARGLTALHEAGMLHRDIKPSNVLVTPTGRVVILDFGLVTDLTLQTDKKSRDIVGTPEYMSPERATGLPETEASDWYSVGIMLYEALTGQVPFFGNYLEIMVDKMNHDPIPPNQVKNGLPEDLTTLCLDLIKREPQQRPTGREILHRLGAEVDEPKREKSQFSRMRFMPFIGRTRHLDILRNAFQRLASGSGAAVFLHGSSGIGKSSLIRHFLEELLDTNTVILKGRCYERESVPYKALDSLIDNLSRFLKNLPAKEAETFLPRDVLTLARLFPVLLQVDSVAKKRRVNIDIPDSQELRRRAFAALKELLARVGDVRPLVLFIDDLQWGDIDSAALLSEILRPPDPPVLLLLASYRSEEAATSPMLKALAPLRNINGNSSSNVNGNGSGTLNFQEVSVEELTFPEACELALTLLAEEIEQAKTLAEIIARESGCNPFFIAELARYFQAGSERIDKAINASLISGTHTVRTTLEEVIKTRVAGLPADARRIIETIAVAGQPLDINVIKSAAEVTAEEQAALATLRASQLVRIRNSVHGSEIESYHDRIRETVIASLSSTQLKDYHHRLAQALEELAEPELEMLAFHYQEAGEREKAARYSAQAADFAAQTLAFDRAVRLYRAALELSDKAQRDAATMKKFGDALVNTGRGLEAAEAYLQAAEQLDDQEAFSLRSRAAEQLLISGNTDKGIDVLNRVLMRLGMKLAATPQRAVFSLLWRRAYLRLRGFKFQERAETELSRAELMRIDACAAAAYGLGLVDPIRGADFQSRHLLLALKAGEPYRLARAVAIETSYSAISGGKSRKRSTELLILLKAVTARVQNPQAQAHAHALALIEVGLVAYGEGRWRKAQEYTERAQQAYRESCTGFAYEVGVARLYSLRSLYYLGELGKIIDRFPEFLKDAEERGDQHFRTNLITRVGYLADLCADAPEKARQGLSSAIERWSHLGVQAQHLFDLMGQTESYLYQSDGRQALEILSQQWPKIAGSLLLRVQVLRIEMYHLRARSALAARGASNEQDKLLQIAEQDARRLEREKMDWSNPLALLVHAAVAQARKDRSRALELLTRAEQDFQAADMELYCQIARLRRGQLMADRAGEKLIAEARESMVQQGITNPAAMANMLAPGDWII